MTWPVTTILIFSIIAMQLLCIKMKKFMNIAGLRYLSVNDLGEILIVSLMFSTIKSSGSVTITLLFLLIYTLFSALLSIDVVTTRIYGYETNLKSLHQFVFFRKQIAKSQVKISDIIPEMTLPLLWPFIFTVGISLVLFDRANALIYCLPFIITIFILAVTKSKLKNNTAALWLLVWIILVLAAKSLNSVITPLIAHQLSFTLLLCIFITSILGRFFKEKHNHPFFTSQPILRRIFISNPIKEKKSISISNEDQRIITVPQSTPSPSVFFGNTPDANVLLITLESLSSEYLQPKNPAGFALPFYQTLAQKGWTSDYHIVPCANSNNAYHDMYTGNYYQRLQFPYLSKLHSSDYTTLYIEPVTGLETLGGDLDLYQNIGFQHIISRDTVSPKDPSDKAFFKAVVEQQRNLFCSGKKFYCHIRNVQSHVPYKVYEQQPPNDKKNRYIKSIEESERTIQDLINTLTDWGVMKNTIVIFTGDHGQSFGEYDYHVHSNAITKQQINVPFALHHPNLSPRTISHSSHFDILPTILDLLGIDVTEKVIGEPLFSPQHQFSHILYSETRQGNLPSCFGHINQNRKIYIDLVHDRQGIMDLQDNFINRFKGSEKQYYQQLMLRALLQRGLVNRPIQMELSKTDKETLEEKISEAQYYQ